MRHRNDTFKLGRDSGHRRCLVANMLKELVVRGKIRTTVPKAKRIKRYADKMVTLAKEGTLAARRRAIAKMMIRFNPLTSKEARLAKEGMTNALNGDRAVIRELFEVIGPRFQERQGGYTRITRVGNRVGDGAELCVLEFLAE